MPFSPSGIDMAAKRLPRTGIMTSGYAHNDSLYSPNDELYSPNDELYSPNDERLRPHKSSRIHHHRH